jgi:hypothetical protein
MNDIIIIISLFKKRERDSKCFFPGTETKQA